MSDKYILYSSEGCHLCEQALEICLPLLAEKLTIVDIVDDEHLVAQYGVHIPVLVKENKQELFWPFDFTDVQAFIEA